MSNLFSYAVISIVSVSVIYGIIRAPALVKGPEILIFSPQNERVYSLPIKVYGRLLRSSVLSINDKQLYTDKYGNFSKTLSPPKGYTSIKIYTKDKKGREKTVYRNLIIK